MGGTQRKPDGLRPASSEMLRVQTVECLELLLKRSSALRFACLGTADGRLLASVNADAQSNGERIAAMTSSLLALSESFAKDALRGHCNYSVVATDHGSIVVVRVPHVGRGYMLSVGADGSELMALTLRAALDTAERLSRIIADASAAAA